MPFSHGATNPKFAPTATVSSVTNFNQSQGTFNGVVSGNKYQTTVYFDYSTSSTFSSYSSVMSGVTSNQSVTFNSIVAGLTPATVYYVRIRAINIIGTTVTAPVSFTTWSLKTYLNTTAGSYSVSIPSIPGVAPTLYEMLIYGGGGAAAYSGGGGGGYRLFSSHTSSVQGTQNISVVIGAGGTNPTNATPAPAGGASSLTIGSSSWVAGGGGGGRWLTDGAGAVGSGNNPAYGGGNGYYGYVYVCGYNNYICGYDKSGNPQYCQDPNSPIYCTDYNRYSGGGGAGTDGGGGNAGYPDVGGNGGAGGGAYGLRGGNGGRGGGTASFGAMGSVPAGSGPVVGTGGAGWWGAGVAGGITFKYYGP